ncbi:MAG TPA: pitrilysin family protein [Planctomycetia bacterium]|nr:pitrilysin family protein [Planctomycetia bacterium]
MRRTVALYLVLFAATLANAAPPDLPVESFKLKNGLKVVLHRDPTVPRVAVVVAYHVGAKNERAGRTGFAHFFEHMMFRGTPNVPNYDIPLQEAGVSTNAFTSEDVTVYHETVPANFLERALYLEAERMAFLPAGLDQKKFDVEREVVKNERRQSYENVPYGLAEEAILANLFPKGSPYSWSVIGSMKDLNAATVDDLRLFFAEYYHPGNASLCLSGDFDPAAAKAWIEKYFAPLKPGPTKRKVEVPVVPKFDRRIVMKDRVQFPRIYLAYPTVGENAPDAPALDVLGTLLSSGDASRLERLLVRDKQIAQDVSAENDARESAGYFEISATAAEGKDLPELEAAIRVALAELAAKAPEKAELDRALAKYEKGTYHSLVSLLGRGVMFAIDSVQHDDPKRYQKRFDAYFKVTPADLQRVAKQYLAEQRLALEVRPMGEKEEQSAAYLAGPAPGGKEEAIPPRTPDAGPDWKAMPGPAAPASFTPPSIVKRELKNGATVYVVPWKTLPIAQVRIQMPVGSADDPGPKAGLARLTASLAVQGTMSRDAVAFAEALDALGASQTVAVGSDATQLAVDVLKRNLDATLALVGEMLSAPRFDKEDFDREKMLLGSELQQGPDDPNWIARRAFRAVMHGPEHPYGRPADGTIDTVKSLTLEDVKKFHADRYASRGARIVVVGDVEPDAVVASLDAALGPWDKKGPEVVARAASAPKLEPGTIYVVDKPGAVQSVVRVGAPWRPRKDPYYLPALVANRVLGGDFLARINQNLREKNGFTYGAYSTFRFLRDRGSWETSSGIRGDATGPALKELLGEIDGVRGARPFKPEEIAVNRGAIVRSFPEEFETPEGIAGALSEVAEFDLPLTEWADFIGRLEKLAAAEIPQSFADAVDPSKRIILIVGDRKAVEPQLKTAGYAKLKFLTPEGADAK